MLENIPSQPSTNPDGYNHAQEALQWMQQQLVEQGLTVTPEEALKLFGQKIIHDIKRGIQQDLAEHGIDVSPDEAVAICNLQFYHDLMKRTGITDPHEAR
jgi:GTP cyclohydrolase I